MSSDSQNILEKDDIVCWYVLVTHNMMFEKTERYFIRQYGKRSVFTFKFKDVVEKNGKLVKKDNVYALKTLMFVRASVNQIKRARMEVKAGKMAVPFRFYLNRLRNIEDDRLTFTDEQMDNFIRTYESIDHAPNLMSVNDLPPLKPNQMVRIVSGSLCNVKGRYLQLRRGQKKRFIATLPNLIAVEVKLNGDELMEIVPADEAFEPLP